MASPPTIQEYVTRDHWKDFSYKLPDKSHAFHQPNKASPMRVSYTMIEHVNAILPFSSATSVLDIACGPGTIFNALFDSGVSLSPTAELLATDISPSMIEQIKTRQKDTQPGGDNEATWSRVRAWAADATDLSGVPAGSQSHVLSQMGIFLVPDADKALAEAKRVMRKDAPAVFSMTTVAWAAWNDDILKVVEELHPARKLPVMADTWRVAALLKTYLEKHGFRNVKVVEVRMAMGFQDEAQMVEGLWANLVFMKDLTRDMSDEEIAVAKSKMVERMKQRFPDKELPGMALLATATV